MRIAIFTQHYYPENFRINYIVQELKKNNQIFIYTSKPHYNLKKSYTEKYKKKYSFVSRKRNLEIIRFSVWFKKKNYLSKLLNYLSYIINVSFYLLSRKKKKIDIIFVYATSPIFQCIPAILYKFLTKKPLIIWVQDLWPEVLQDLKIPFSNVITFLINPIINWIYNKCDVILCQSSSYKKKIYKLTKTRTILFENPSDVIRKKIKYNFDKNYLRVVFAGNLGDAQDLKTLIKLGLILKKNKNKIIIDILGDGKNFLFLKKNIEKYQLTKYLNLQGYIQNRQLSNFYQKSFALLIMLARGAGISKTIPAKFQTYLAYGRPLLACSNGEVSQIVRRNNLGLSCTSGNANRLYRNIMLIKKMNLKKYNQICQNCFNIYRDRYLITKKNKELINIFENCIKSFKGQKCKKN
jgi:hypothetical protein